jgi:hypothetical protein
VAVGEPEQTLEDDDNAAVTLGGDLRGQLEQAFEDEDILSVSTCPPPRAPGSRRAVGERLRPGPVSRT